MRYEEIIVTLEGSGYLFLLFAWRTRAMTAAMSMQNWKIPSHVTSIPVTPSRLRSGAKEASPPKKSRGTAYRGTGSTSDSVARISTDCKGKEPGHDRLAAGHVPVFRHLSYDFSIKWLTPFYPANPSQAAGGGEKCMDLRFLRLRRRLLKQQPNKTVFNRFIKN